MMHLFNEALPMLVQGALKRLLAEKHLYQSVDVDLVPLLAVSKQIREEIKRAGPNPSNTQPMRPPATVEEILASGIVGIGVPWVINAPGVTNASLRGSIVFTLPHINTFCSRCESRPPFNPVLETCSVVLLPGDNQTQWYDLAYECQQCKGVPVRFLVRREGLKLRLCGRDPIEAVPAPKVLPKAQSKFYSDAQIAHSAGQTLAGIFLLRTFIEQFWRSVPEVKDLIKQQPRATGDEQGAAYQNTLPVEFKNRFPSLSDIYGKLSAAMHEANADATLFEASCARVEEHFDARRLFKLMGGS